MDIIVVIISSHGEESVEQHPTRHDTNILRHRFYLQDKDMYTDDLLNQFKNHHSIHHIPKLFFVQVSKII